mmetsp:Transcript_10801/g.27191  ORF Transcript_10801/g.27191 Transcript_10801/m.27191 type:complete len:325 (-) Transcript_10801:4-978(-)
MSLSGSVSSAAKEGKHFSDGDLPPALAAFSSEQALPLKVHVRLLIVHVAVLVLELLVLLVVEILLLLLLLKSLPQLKRVVDFRDFRKNFVVWNAEAPHAVLVPGLLEVLLEGAPPEVREVAADLALELLVEPVQLVEPVRNRLAVPAHGELERVVDDVLVIVLLLLVLARHGAGAGAARRARRLPQLVLSLVLHVRRELLVRAGGLLLHLSPGRLHRRRKEAGHGRHLALEQRHRLAGRLPLRRLRLAPRRGLPLGEELAVQILQLLPLRLHQALSLLAHGTSRLEPQRHERLLQPIRAERLQVAARLEVIEVDRAGHGPGLGG